MKIKELIRELEKLPPEMELIAYEPESAQLALINGLRKTNIGDRMITALSIGKED